MEGIEIKDKNMITVAPINVKEIENSKKDSEIVLSEVKDVIIKDNAGYQWAGNFIRTISGKIDELNAKRKSITKPLDIAKKNIMEMFKEPISKLENSKLSLDFSMRDYLNKQEQIRLETERKLQVEADKKRKEAEKKAEKFREKGKETKADEWEEKAETIVAPNIVSNVPKVEGISYRDQWSAEIIDFKLLSDDYKIANNTALNKIAQATKGSLTIPGVKFICKKILATRK